MFVSTSPPKSWKRLAHDVCDTFATQMTSLMQTAEHKTQYSRSCFRDFQTSTVNKRAMKMNGKPKSVCYCCFVPSLSTARYASSVSFLRKISAGNSVLSLSLFPTPRSVSSCGAGMWLTGC